MLTNFLQRITIMMFWIAIGVVAYVIAPTVVYWWIALIVVGISGYFIWSNYRAAKQLANIIDLHRDIINVKTSLILLNNVKSESKGQGEEQKPTESAVETETDREDESEDYCAHPI